MWVFTLANVFMAFRYRGHRLEVAVSAFALAAVGFGTAFLVQARILRCPRYGADLRVEGVTGCCSCGLGLDET